MRIGQGYDVHRLVEGRDLILGGVTVPYEKGLLGHSDADVLVHAVMGRLAERHLGISDSLFRIQILGIKAFPVSSCWKP